MEHCLIMFGKQIQQNHDLLLLSHGKFKNLYIVLSHNIKIRSIHGGNNFSLNTIEVGFVGWIITVLGAGLREVSKQLKDQLNKRPVQPAKVLVCLGGAEQDYR